MKPFSITLSGWGPYAGKEHIDFAKYNEAGIFLITGPTGSGKTTIFDGIAYALYGEVSGSIRSKESLRSDFADVSTDTYVEFCFSHKDKEYKIKRSPKYMRPKKRGKGLIATNEEAVLWDGDRIVTGVGKVNDKVKEILAIDYRQFKQLSMIAQGEFQKLLIVDDNKKVNERVEILRNIFQTQIYEKLQILAGEKARTLKNQIRELDFKMEEATDRIPVEGEEFSCARERKDFGLFAELVSKEWCKWKKEADFSEAKMLQLEEIMQKIEMQEELQKQWNQVKQEIEILKEEQNALKLQKKQQTEWIHQLELEQTEQEEKKRKLQEKEQWILRLEKIEQKENELSLALEKTRSKQEKVSEIESQIKKDRIQVEQWKNELKLQSEILIEEANVSALQEKLGRERNQIYNLHEKLQKKESMEKELYIVQKAYIEAKQERILKRTVYEQMQMEFQDGMAGILAQTLEENKPCPVCGSCNHPKKASISKNVPLKEEVEQAKTLWEEKEQIFLKALAAAKGKKEALEQWEKEVRKEKEQILGVCTIEEKIDLIDSQLEKNQQELTKIKAHKEYYQKIQKKCERFECKIEDYENQKNSLQEAYQKKQEEVIRLKGMIDVMRKELPDELPERKNLQKSIKDLKEKILDFQKRWEQEHKKMQHLLQQEEANRAVRKEKSRQNIQLKERVLKEELPQKEEVKEKYQKLKSQVKILHGNMQQTKDALNSLKSKIKQKKKLEEQYGIAGDVDALMNGRNARALKFEQYVLMAYFDDVLKAANQRMLVMTNGRYELFRVEELSDARRKNHLDIEVLDYYTGKKRPVKSLSGGESFKAALCLALGLSDIVQSYAGGIQIEVLFIDEGFGSLDEESLEQAVETLKKLSSFGCTIGIISHVSELKEKIDAQILVEKSNVGSKIRER